MNARCQREAHTREETLGFRLLERVRRGFDGDRCRSEHRVSLSHTVHNAQTWWRPDCIEFEELDGIRMSFRRDSI
jgi:hypothetical protein